MEEIKNEVCRYCGDKECDRSCKEVSNDTLIGISIVIIGIFMLVFFIVKYHL